MKKIILYYMTAPVLPSRALRLHAASDWTGDPVRCFTEDTGVCGKPYFPSHPDVHFSVSHSGSFWVCAFSDGEVGCDVQEFRKNDDPVRLNRLAERWFSEGERRYLDGHGRTPAEFYRIWTRKEAYVKFTGHGIGRGNFPAFDVTSPLPDCTVRDLRLPDAENYAAALVSTAEAVTELRELVL